MSLTNTQYAAVMRMYDDIHTHNAAIQNERYKEVTSLCPQYQTIEDEIISLSMQEAAKRIGNDSSDTNTDEFNERLQSLIKQKAVLLASIGKPSHYLDNIYTCKKCQDTGYINGTRCSCFKKKAIDLIYHDSNLKNITANENFSTFSFDLYDKTTIDSATGLTPYNNIHKVFDVCQSFVKTFDTNFSNLLLLGETGVGKTFLSNCIAKELLDSYHSVIYLTAIELFKCFENSDFNKGEDVEYQDVSYFIDCDLLIIDDLGTESYNSYTISKLFYVINERILRRKSVIISTNLSMPQLENTYSERIFSRLISAYTILRLFCEDIRVQQATKRKH